MTLTVSSDSQISFGLERTEVCYWVQGQGALEAGLALFGSNLKPHVLQYLAWLRDAPPAGVVWFPPARLEIRVPALDPWPSLLAARLAEVISKSPDNGWRDLLADALARLEAWMDSDVDQGGGAEELAAELEALQRQAPTPESRQAIGSARDALDDGLPAEAVAAALYRARSLSARVASQV